MQFSTLHLNHLNLSDKISILTMHASYFLAWNSTPLAMNEISSTKKTNPIPALPP